ncbi:ATP-dependent RNA helicase A [Lates japonicus]|uniref:ATP-dependent RNA helicase A n=1 Tax=Lates japonicus TaxID=270547 RepID=A0AAD3RNW9_LATJO|nr:ATP-dependent RNA helicase A [Lates japonicus]
MTSCGSGPGLAATRCPSNTFEEEIMAAQQPADHQRADGLRKTTQVPQYILTASSREAESVRLQYHQWSPAQTGSALCPWLRESPREGRTRRSCGYSPPSPPSDPTPASSSAPLAHDFLMMVLRDVVQAYPEVRVILMSATIDTTMFREYFFNCPIIEVLGRTFPVQEYFLEDCIQMTNFIPPPVDRKKKDKDEEGDDDVRNLLL